jgi:hypothetical protein
MGEAYVEVCRPTTVCFISRGWDLSIHLSADFAFVAILKRRFQLPQLRKHFNRWAQI